ncbi:polyribonucleotide nucleotidyltransferase [Bacillus sp. BHET2]|uniref:polyribonucleotide nucleotidyltransferase n=1 Tax=Bacillus sp. BHET2 TaxID=2583818 RepID=UPI00110ED4EB|nr:polyribonucleotide nucleotidyltransferase [Bacillus sp. BHET2]TMU86007.1 polyribonucleotide nucleotidyltransferase [Bacillus sp. BHET2]
MDVSSIMGKQVAELQHTLSMNLLKSQMATQTAQVTVMMKEMQVSQPVPHPSKGLMVDVKG